jgi:anti-anti-sigma factor
MPEPPAFSAHAERRDGAAVVVVGGELDLATVETLRSVLARPEAQSDTLVLDLREVTFIDSSGLSVIVASHQKLRQAQGRFAVVVAQPSAVQRLFELCGLTEALTITDDLDAALVA